MADTAVLDQLGTYRKTDRDPRPVEGVDGSIAIQMDGQGVPAFDEASGTTQVEVEDGAVVIAFGPPENEQRESKDFDENIAELLSEGELSTIAERLLMGIEQDEQSRSEWLENVSAGLSLLGLEIKNPRGAAVAGTTPSEGVSTVDHPLLLEAVLRFQANARGELLPSDGPVKVRNDGEGTALSSRLATALEKDLNHYLEKVAKEYYPDTDRMLLMLGFSGISFKKGYHDPIKRRPVIKSIDAKDLIVSNASSSLDDSGRVTHRIMMRPSVLKRMQLLGAYRKTGTTLGAGMVQLKNAVDAKIDEIQGIAAPTVIDPEDQDRELYECYCELDIPGYEHEMDGEATGLPLPYKVTIDKEARTILEVRRNWLEDDDLYLPRNRIIAYTFIPGLGFYGIGLLNVLGNATKAVTAAWRLMLDAGMFSNFPGFLYIKQLSKQMTNQFRVAPGSGVGIDTMGADIRTQVMPLPYKDPSAVFVQLIDNIALTAQRVGGTAELQVGEGNADAPVGTTLAMMEQATKLMSAVHKRAHQAQGQEFELLLDLLKEDPEALWRHNRKSAVLAELTAEMGQTTVVAEAQESEERRRQLFLTALSDCTLVPRADPNTSSQTERYLKVIALRQMAQTNPAIDMNRVDERIMTIMGIDDSGSLFKPPPPPGSEPPSPEAMTAQATLMAAQARISDAQTRKEEIGVKATLQQADNTQKIQLKLEEIASKERIAALGVAKAMIESDFDTQQAIGVAEQQLQESHLGRQHQIQLADLNHRHTIEQAQTTGKSSESQGVANLQQTIFQKLLDQDHTSREGSAQRDQADRHKLLEIAHASDQSERDRQHKAELAEKDRQVKAQQARMAAKKKDAATKPKPKKTP